MGRGRRLFPDGTPPTKLTLVESNRFILDPLRLLTSLLTNSRLVWRSIRYLARASTRSQILRYVSRSHAKGTARDREGGVRGRCFHVGPHPGNIIMIGPENAPVVGGGAQVDRSPLTLGLKVEKCTRRNQAVPTGTLSGVLTS